MASTYSPSLRIELIGDGDQSGTWGQTTNSNLGSLIEQSVAGVVAITMVDANYTLTNYNGVADEARNQVLVASGTNNAVRNIIAPLVEKTYIVKNSTTGGYAIQIIGSSGLGVTIANGVTTSVYCDGVNFYAASTGSASNFAVGNNLTVAGTTNLTGAATTAAISATTIGGTTITAATQFTGPGTGLTGTAASLTAGNATVAAAATTMATTNWTVLESGGYLYFKYGGVNKMRLDSSGNMICSGNVTAYGSI